MSESVTFQTKHIMTEQEIEEFLCSVGEFGASLNMIRRFKTSIASLYEFLPKDKRLSKSALQLWRSDMEKKGYASATPPGAAPCLRRPCWIRRKMQKIR